MLTQQMLHIIIIIIYETKNICDRIIYLNYFFIRYQMKGLEVYVQKMQVSSFYVVGY